MRPLRQTTRGSSDNGVRSKEPRHGGDAGRKQEPRRGKCRGIQAGPTSRAKDDRRGDGARRLRAQKRRGGLITRRAVETDGTGIRRRLDNPAVVDRDPDGAQRGSGTSSPREPRSRAKRCD